MTPRPVQHGVGSQSLEAQPSSATRGRVRDRSASNGVASRFNVRSALHSGARKFIPEQSENLHLSRSATN